MEERAAHPAPEAAGPHQARLAHEYVIDEVFALRSAVLVTLAHRHGGSPSTIDLAAPLAPTSHAPADVRPPDVPLPRMETPPVRGATSISRAAAGPEAEAGLAAGAVEPPPESAESPAPPADASQEPPPSAARAAVWGLSAGGPLLPGGLPIDLNALRDEAGAFFDHVERLSPEGGERHSLVALAAWLAVAGAAAETARRSTRWLAGRTAFRRPDPPEVTSEH
jgi:hypothetical protein